MHNQKMENRELLNKYNVKFDAQEWTLIVLGIRKTLNLSQIQLSKKLGICRQSISRFEAKQRVPNDESISKILAFIKENNFNVEELIKIGNNYVDEYLSREKFNKLNLEKSEENLLASNIGFESYKRFSFYNIAFVRYLEQDCGIKCGSKSKSNIGIPKWCLERKEFASAVLRGLFDTDGYFAYCGGSLEIMYGRFSDKCTQLVYDIKTALNFLEINHVIKHTKDGRYRIRILNKKEVLRFFSIVGTSNIKHIIRFLLWRISRYEAKIEKEGLIPLMKTLNEMIKMDISNVKLPFHWGIENYDFSHHINIDNYLLKGLELRNLFKWNIFTKDLSAKIGDEQIANCLGINTRSVRKYKDGTRIPSAMLVHKLINLAKNNNIQIQISNYKRD
ncbi:helix-turn-helix domain-containing protein [Candidatus Woesearchaeota archaeon]|nr:helix-turn-helix domain-containing protein [Candidatus Woesearchaeota archaeon]